MGNEKNGDIEVVFLAWPDKCLILPITTSSVKLSRKVSGLLFLRWLICFPIAIDSADGIFLIRYNANIYIGVIL